jgi:hypothetical protein
MGHETSSGNDVSIGPAVAYRLTVRGRSFDFVITLYCRVYFSLQFNYMLRLEVICFNLLMRLFCPRYIPLMEVCVPAEEEIRLVYRRGRQPFKLLEESLFFDR